MYGSILIVLSALSASDNPQKDKLAPNLPQSLEGRHPDRCGKIKAAHGPIHGDVKSAVGKSLQDLGRKPRCLLPKDQIVPIAVPDPRVGTPSASGEEIKIVLPDVLPEEFCVRMTLQLNMRPVIEPRPLEGPVGNAKSEPPHKMEE